VTIENSSIHDVNFAGIFVLSNQTPPTLTATVKGNRVSSTGTGISDQAGGTVTGNVVSAGFDGIDLTNESTASATGNTVTNTQRAITVGSGGNAVKANIIWNSSIAGISLFGSGATIEANNITQGSVGIEFGCFTGTVSSNTINDAGVGIESVPSSVILVNTFENVDITRTGGC
jgi:parallel beta-helix repeat protein